MYDPQVEESQIYQDLGTEKFEWDHPSPRSAPIAKTAIAIVRVSGAAAGSRRPPCQAQWDGPCSAGNAAPLPPC